MTRATYLHLMEKLVESKRGKIPGIIFSFRYATVYFQQFPLGIP